MKLGLLVLAAAVIPPAASPSASRRRYGHGLHFAQRARLVHAPRGAGIRHGAVAPRRVGRAGPRGGLSQGRAVLPSHVPGETLEHYGERLDEDRRRLDAYRKDEAFLPDNRAGESPTSTSSGSRRTAGEERRTGKGVVHAADPAGEVGHFETLGIEAPPSLPAVARSCAIWIASTLGNCTVPE